MMMPKRGDGWEWRRRYRAHLASARWKNIRQDLFRLRGNRCERCGHGHWRLEVHHKTYERLGRERASDLEVVCPTCHEAADRDRERTAARKRAQNRYNSGLDTFASKKYGDDWEMGYISECDAAEAFNRWLEEKNRW
jgi:hypothetical protein